MNLESRASSLETTSDFPDHKETTTAVPNYPGFLTPSPAELRKAFGVAMVKLESSRGREPSRIGYAAECHTAVFNAGLRAPGGHWGRGSPTPGKDRTTPFRATSGP